MKNYPRDLSRHFYKKDIQMANKNMKTCSTTLLVIREMQIKTTMRYHFILTSTAITKKDNNKCCQACRKTGALIYCWWECKTVGPLSSLAVPQKVK